MYLTQGLHRSLQCHPAKLALRPLEGDGAPGLDFAGLLRQVAQLAAALQYCGVAAGDRVALLSPNTPALVQQLLACWWLGAVACPLNPDWRSADLRQAVAECGASLLVVDPALALLASQAGLATALNAGGSEIDSLRLASLAATRMPLGDSRTGGDALAALVYTAGTAGPRRAVMLTHANLWAAALAGQAAPDPQVDTVALLVVPLCQAAGLAHLAVQLVAGATCLTLAACLPETTLQAIEAGGVNEILLPPGLLQALLRHPAFDPGRLQGLRRISTGAAALAPALLAGAQAAWPAAELVQAYGLTESAASACVQRLGPRRPWAAGDAAWQGRRGTAGRAGLATELRIVDPQGADLPQGRVGEIVLRGPSVMPGYWQQPEATARALQDGWLRTGDAGRLDPDGYLFVVDRFEDVIISGGETVYSAEVEGVLRQLAAVEDVAVVGLPHAVWGSAVHAVVVPRPGAWAQAEALRRYCRNHLAGYKCPRSLSFADSLPLASAGQVNKRLLRESLPAQLAKSPQKIPRST